MHDLRPTIDRGRIGTDSPSDLLELGREGVAA